MTTATEIKTVAGMEKIIDAEVKGKLLQFGLYCQKEGLAECTGNTFVTAIRSISRHGNINDPESVKEALAKNMKISENTKFLYSCAYTRLLSFQGKTWSPPKYSCEDKLPAFLPTEAELDQLIAGCGKRLSALLQLIKETGMRLGECLRLTWININFETRIITLMKAEKHGLPRVFQVSTVLMGMLGSLPRQNEKVFGRMNKCSAIRCLVNQRKRIAYRFGNPRIAEIHFHLIRHWFGTVQFHKIPDPDYIARLLGHKNWSSTQIYVNLEKMAFGEGSNDYIVKVASTTEEAQKLMEVGFDYVCTFDGKMMLRKRK